MEGFTIAVVCLILFLFGWLQNIKLEAINKKLDLTLNRINGLKEYLYEIDPQFDDEREMERRVFEGELLAGANHCQLIKQKEEEGKRTLTTPLSES